MSAPNQLGWRIILSLLFVAIIALAWVALYRLNCWVFADWSTSEFVTYVFLPSGLRIMSVLLFSLYAVFGLFIGSVVTSPHLASFPLDAIAISMISSVTPYVVYQLSKRTLGFDGLLNGLKSSTLWAICFVFALLNSFFHNLYFHYRGFTQNFFQHAFAMFIGDFFGAVLVIFSLYLTIKITKQIRSKRH